LAIEITTISDSQFADLLERGEGHLLDFKAKEVSPAKLTKALSAFANADGGELFIGVLNSGWPPKRWSGFVNAEAANSHIQTFEQFFLSEPTSNTNFFDPNVILDCCSIAKF
jgi:ATP-dependent DNA helicase RecG